MGRKRRGEVPRLFLSHSSRDRRFVDRLAAGLRAHGLAVWYSQSSLIGAQQWHDEIGRALEQCNWFVLVLSRHATASPWVKRELTYALWDRHYNGRIVPILHRPCDYVGKLSWTLTGFQFIDFTGGYEEGMEGLLRVWGVAEVV